MKKLLFTLSFILCFSISVHASDISNWAEESFNNLSSYGILTTDIVRKNMQENITREEFCSLIINIYKCDKRIVLSEEDKNVFDDTTSTAVLEAYKTGIVSGKGDRQFEPDSAITRQEMAVMISRTLNLISNDYNKYDGQKTSYLQNFSDANQTADWALSEIAAICDYKIITGNDINEVQPLNNATREQAICMLDRVYKKFVSNTSLHTVPRFKSLNKQSIFEGNVIASWPSITGVQNYTIIIKSDNSDTVVINVPARATSINEFNESLSDKDSYTIFIGAKKSYGAEIFSKPIYITKKSAAEATPETTEPSTTPQLIRPETTEEDNTIINEENISPNESETFKDNPLIHSTDRSALEEKKRHIFPDGVPFESAEIAEQHIIEVEVPVWRLHDDGTKSSSVAYIEVNEALAEDVVSIFTEIYNDSSQFPIKNVGGYSWRNTSGGRVSQHSYGSCIDINYEENYYVEPDGTPITGDLWLPGENPYSIAEDSIVVTTFAKYGWLWGGNAWSEKYAKDYMHFTYLGN